MDQAVLLKHARVFFYQLLVGGFGCGRSGDDVFLLHELLEQFRIFEFSHTSQVLGLNGACGGLGVEVIPSGSDLVRCDLLKLCVDGVVCVLSAQDSLAVRMLQICFKIRLTNKFGHFGWLLVS